MNTNDILNKLMEISHQPFLIFANRVGEKPDNALKTLQLLATEEQVTAGRISEHLDIKPSSVTQIIKKLEATDMIARVKSETDARVTFVILTEKGNENLKERGTISTDLKEELFKGFSEQELEQLESYLTRISKNSSSEEFQRKLNDIFSDDKRWQRFGSMPNHFDRAREQILERSNFDDFQGCSKEFRGGFGRDERFFGGRRR